MTRLPRVPAGIVLAAVLSTVLSVFPVCLLGPLSLVIRTDLHFTASQLAFAVGAFYACSALSALAVGRFGIAERVGVRTALGGGLTVTATSMALIALVADSWTDIGVLLALSGAANGLIQPGANLALAQGVPRERLGIAFGIKQSAVPTATLFAGLAVGVAGVLGGWRWIFGAGALVTAGVLGLHAIVAHTRRSGREPKPNERRHTPRVRLDPLILRIAIAGSLGSVANNTMRVFFVESAVAQGESLTTAGLILSLASASGIITRLIGGWRSDRSSRDPLTSAAVMMIIGSFGYALMSYASGTLTLIVAAVFGIAMGWGWAGLLQLGLVRTHTGAAGSASGYLHFGTLLGSLIGPILFGLLLGTSGQPVAWLAIAAFGLLAGVVLLVHRPKAPPPAGVGVATAPGYES